MVSFKGIKVNMASRLDETTWKGWHTDVLVMLHAGHENKEIAKRIHKSVGSVLRIKDDPFFKKKLASYSSTYQQSLIEKRTSYITDSDLTGAREVINEACRRAAQIVVDMAENCEDPRTKLAACKDILDRAGLKPVEVTETRERVYSTEEVEHAQRTLQETVEIVERLNGNTSSFVLSESGRGQLVSSVTDESSDDQVISSHTDA